MEENKSNEKQVKNKVLIVDDNQKNLQVLSNILYEKNLSILISNNGKQALEIAEKKLPDLILLDIMMPGMNGYEVCEKLKSNQTTSHIPVIFLTALNEPDNIVKGFKCGGIDYITKPFNSSELLARVFTHIDYKIAQELIKNQNDRLVSLNRKLESLNATRDKFFSIIAHDLKGPLNSILSMSTLLDEHANELREGETELFIQLIRKTSKSQLNLLNNLLAWARLQTGGLKLEPVHFNLNKLITENIQLLRASAENKQIKIEVDLSDKIQVYADENMVATILRNLISNAFKFTNNGGEVKITSYHKEKYVEVKISDTGIGMSENTVRNLFREDVNTSSIGTDKETGTGLGLILCNDFIKRNGGEIFVESILNEGTDIMFSLPKNKSLSQKAEKTTPQSV